MTAGAAHAETRLEERADSYMGAMNPTAAASARVRAPPTLRLVEGVMQASDHDENEGEILHAPGEATVLPGGDGDGGEPPAPPRDTAVEAQPEYNRDTPLETLKEVVQRRKCLKAIKASGLYSADEITPFEARPIDELRAIAEETEEKTRLLAYLTERDLQWEPKVLKSRAIFLSWSILLICPLVTVGGVSIVGDDDDVIFSTFAAFNCVVFGVALWRAVGAPLFGFTATLLGTLRDDGFALFAATSTAVLLFLAREIDDPSPSQVWWILSNPILILISSVDVWFLRFDRAALDRILPHVPFVREKPDGRASEPAHWDYCTEPDLEDLSMRNGLRAANLLSSRISAAFFYRLAFFAYIVGFVAVGLPLSDLEGRLSGVDVRGADILRYTVATYGGLTILIGFSRVFRRDTFKFTVRNGDGFRRATTSSILSSILYTPDGSRERVLLCYRWTPGVDWLASRIGLEIRSDGEFVYFENLQMSLGQA